MKFARPESPHSGIVVALSALRSEASPASGEFEDLILLGELASEWGFDLVQLLPVNDSGGMSSPYTALSAFALHPLYLRISKLPEARAQPGFIERARELALSHANNPRLDYAGYLGAKLVLLEELFLKVVAGESPQAWLEQVADFAAWEEQNRWIRAYSVFSELKRRASALPWWEWAEDRAPTAARIDALWEDRELAQGTRFFAWMQFRADSQFRAATEALIKNGVEILGDIPILIGRDSADVWSSPATFGQGLSAGSPPDGENPLGQNWGFPIYDWEALARDDFGFWRDRLAVASRYYSAYRIDHVLGFFRIWALGEREQSGYLGRFAPSLPILREELNSLGFDENRLRWLSRPHLPLWSLHEATGGDASLIARVIASLLDRIGSEDLYLFKTEVRGELDIVEALATCPERLCELMKSSWRDRALLEYASGSFVPTWNWEGTTAWASLSDSERQSLLSLAATKRRESDARWEVEGKKILSKLVASCDMLPTAEDLGGIPPYVPRVLDELSILGLRVLRWTRKWKEAGQPYVPAEEWPSLSVACPSVHDSSTLREWWTEEADRDLTWSWAQRTLGRELGPPPEKLDPVSARIILQAITMVSSRIAVYPIQDLLAMSEKTASDPREERINVPGSDNAWNWGYRLPHSLEYLRADKDLRAGVRSLADSRKGLRP